MKENKIVQRRSIGKREKCKCKREKCGGVCEEEKRKGRK